MIEEILKNIKEFYYTNQTKDLDFRIEQLKKLRDSFKKYEPEIVQALKDDLRKPEFEIYTTEFGFVLQEIDFAIRHLKKWARPEKAGLPIFLKPAKGCIMKEPYGVALIIVPFNYPMQLAFAPLIGAIAAGNCAVVKASKRTPASAKVICKIIADAFNPNYIKCLLPTEISSDELVNSEFDYIFFTGSTETGRQVAQTAAKKLIPYTLELGGKSPVIVDKTANIELAAKKITWAKFLNCGQTCIAPDYVITHYDVKDKLVHEIIKCDKENTMKLNIEHITEKSTFWNSVNILAKEAFPPEEYLAPSELVRMAQADNFDFLALLDGNTFVGFMVVQTYEDMAYLFFLRLIQRVGVRGMVAEPLKL